MRVTNNISQGTYLKNNRKINSSMLKSMTRIMTQRRFNRVSEDIVNGVTALTIRRQLRNVDIYEKNLNACKELFASAEQVLIRISDDAYLQMESELVAAANGTYEQMELDIFSQSFDQLAEKMVKSLNADFAERQLFGGTNNSVPPFSIEQAIITTEVQQTNEDGELLFEKEDGTQEYISAEDWAAMTDEDKAEYTAVTKTSVVYPPNWTDYYKEDEETGGVATDPETGELLLKDGVTMDDIPKSVLYNGVPVNFDVVSNRDLTEGTYTVKTLGLDENGLKAFTDNDFEVTKEAINSARNKHDNSLVFPGSNPIYVDIGIGIKYYADGSVDPQTALDVSLNGAAITGCGVDDGGFSKNLIQLALDTAYNLRKGINVATEMNLDKANAALTELEQKTAGGQELSDEDLASISKQLADAKIGAVLIQDEAGNYVVRVGGQEVFSSAVNYGGNAPQLSPGESTDAEYVILESSTGGSIKLSKCIGDQSFVNAVIDKANEANSRVLKQITTLGIKENTIDFYTDRMTDTEINLKERQNVVEGTDMEEEIMIEYNLRAAYEAALKLGGWVIPRSIFDFI